MCVCKIRRRTEGKGGSRRKQNWYACECRCRDRMVPGSEKPQSVHCASTVKEIQPNAKQEPKEMVRRKMLREMATLQRKPHGASVISKCNQAEAMHDQCRDAPYHVCNPVEHAINRKTREPDALWNAPVVQTKPHPHMTHRSCFF